MCRLEKIGGAAVDLDFVPLTNAALMLYGSSFIAERAAGIAPFLRREGEGGKRPREWAAGAAEDERLLPVTRAIMAAAGALPARELLMASVPARVLDSSTNGGARLLAAMHSWARRLAALRAPHACLAHGSAARCSRRAPCP